MPGEKEVGVLLAESVQKVGRLVSRELLPLPIPYPENDVVRSERIRGLSRAVRSRVKRRVGWTNAGVRNLNEIFGKTATSEAGGQPSAMQLSSLCNFCQKMMESCVRAPGFSPVPRTFDDSRFDLFCWRCLCRGL